MDLQEALQELEERKEELFSLISESCPYNERERLINRVKENINSAEINLKQLYKKGYTVGVDFTSVKEFECNADYDILRVAVIEHANRPKEELFKINPPTS